MIPYQQRGQPISPSAFNQLVDMVKSAQITSVVGGTFQRSIGGTSITVLPGTAGASNESAESLPCPFKVSNASTKDEMKVQIMWGLIWQMLPTGMFPDNKPPLAMTITESCYVYSEIIFNTSTLIPTEVKFSVSSELQQNTNTTQYNLIARVEVDEDADPMVIKTITNVCQQPFPSPCSLLSA